jgi:hypothetical protein
MQQVPIGHDSWGPAAAGQRTKALRISPRSALTHKTATTCPLRGTDRSWTPTYRRHAIWLPPVGSSSGRSRPAGQCRGGSYGQGGQLSASSGPHRFSGPESHRALPHQRPRARPLVSEGAVAADAWPKVCKASSEFVRGHALMRNIHRGFYGMVESVRYSCIRVGRSVLG